MSAKAPTGGFGAQQFGETLWAGETIEEDRFKENSRWYRLAARTFGSVLPESWYTTNQNQIN